MPVIQEFGIPFVHWNERSLTKYWGTLSQHVIDKFGYGPFEEKHEVDAILSECFSWMLAQFRQITASERHLGFYKAVAGLNENLIEIMGHAQKNKRFLLIKEQDFVANRNTTRLILERACELDLIGAGSPADLSAVQMERLEDLLYLGMWIWGFAESLAEQQALGDIATIHIDSDRTISITRKHHYSAVIRLISSEFIRLGQKAIFDYDGVRELRVAIKDCLGIDYQGDVGTIPAPLGYHPYCAFPQLADVNYDQLITDYSREAGVSLNAARSFYSGLTITKANKPTLERIVLRPGSSGRHMHRPLLIWTVDGEQRVVCGPDKWAEGMALMAINALQWREVPDEWMNNSAFSEYVTTKFKMHDRILEDAVEGLLKNHHPHYSRNLTKMKLAGSTISLVRPGLGEVDFLYIDHRDRKVYVVDCKYHRPRHTMVGWRTDQTNFENEYEPKLTRKIAWFRDNMTAVQEHFERLFPSANFDLGGYIADGYFVVNTPTLYCFHGLYRAYPIQQLREIFDGEFNDYVLSIEDTEGVQTVRRPFFPPRSPG